MDTLRASPCRASRCSMKITCKQALQGTRRSLSCLQTCSNIVRCRLSSKLLLERLKNRTESDQGADHDSGRVNAVSISCSACPWRQLLFDEQAEREEFLLSASGSKWNQTPWRHGWIFMSTSHKCRLPETLNQRTTPARAKSKAILYTTSKSSSCPRSSLRIFSSKSGYKPTISLWLWQKPVLWKAMTLSNSLCPRWGERRPFSRVFAMMSNRTRRACWCGGSRDAFLLPQVKKIEKRCSSYRSTADWQTAETRL